MGGGSGADPGGGGPGGPDPPPFGGPPNFIKREKTSRACARKCRILVLNSYPDPPLSEILYPPLGVCEVLPLRKGGKVLAMLKEGHKRFCGSFYVVA